MHQRNILWTLDEENNIWRSKSIKKIIRGKLRRFPLCKSWSWDIIHLKMTWDVESTLCSETFINKKNIAFAFGRKFTFNDTLHTYYQLMKTFLKNIDPNILYNVIKFCRIHIFFLLKIYNTCTCILFQNSCNPEIFKNSITHLCFSFNISVTINPFLKGI